MNLTNERTRKALSCQILIASQKGNADKLRGHRGRVTAMCPGRRVSDESVHK